MNAVMKKLTLSILSICISFLVDSHIGSPGVTFEGKAGNYSSGQAACCSSPKCILRISIGKIKMFDSVPLRNATTGYPTLLLMMLSGCFGCVM